MADVEEVQRSPSRSQAVPVFLLSLGFAIAATALLASIADAANWCCVHSWALVHGTGLIVLLFFGLIGFHLVRAVGERLGLLTRPPVPVGAGCRTWRTLLARSVPSISLKI